MTALVSYLGRTLVVFCVFATFLVVPAASQNAYRPLFQNEEGLPMLAPLRVEITPAVVNMSVESRQTAKMNPLLNGPLFRHFFDMLPMSQQPMPRRKMGAGTGVIVDAEDDYALTNHHVVEHGDRIVVTLKDRHHFDAKLIGRDAGTDIALLQIAAGDIAALEIGDSDRLLVGDHVLAIGNPFGLGQTVASGIGFSVPANIAHRP